MVENLSVADIRRCIPRNLSYDGNYQYNLRSYLKLLNNEKKIFSSSHYRELVLNPEFNTLHGLSLADECQPILASSEVRNVALEELNLEDELKSLLQEESVNVDELKQFFGLHTKISSIVLSLAESSRLEEPVEFSCRSDYGEKIEEKSTSIRLEVVSVDSGPMLTFSGGLGENLGISPNFANMSFVGNDNFSLLNEANNSKNAQAHYEEGNEFDYLKTRRLRRSHSLKSCCPAPQQAAAAVEATPRQKKAVRFADALGLDLESVRHILNKEEPPTIPTAVIQNHRLSSKAHGHRYLSALFPQPITLPDFLSRVHERKVVMETCHVDDREMTIGGLVRVANVGFKKHVAVRYSVTRWDSYADISASYIHGSNDGPTDRFSFVINVPPEFDVGCRLEFAVAYSVSGQCYWDNNYGCNYAVECFAKAVSPSGGSDSVWIHFL